MVAQQEPLGYTPKGALGGHKAQSLILGWQIFPLCVGALTAAARSQPLLTCGK